MARSRCLPGGLDAVADDACAEGVKSDGAHEVQWPPPAGVVEKEVEVEVEMEVEVETNLTLGRAVVYQASRSATAAIS